jgi:hypothetical protein
MCDASSSSATIVPTHFSAEETTLPTHSSVEYAHLLGKVRDVQHGGWLGRAVHR